MDDLASTTFVAIEEALNSGQTNIAAVAREVGARAAAFGSPLQEVFDDLERMYSDRGQPLGYDVVKAISVGWSEATLVHQHQISCEDPLTMLSSAAHLRSRLNDVYRAAQRAGVRAGDHYELVVVDLPVTSTNALAVSLALLETADAMRTVYSGDETIAKLSTHRAAALVEKSRTDRLSLELLHVLIRRIQTGDGEPRLWLESLPRRAEGIGWLLAEMAR